MPCTNTKLSQSLHPTQFVDHFGRANPIHLRRYILVEDLRDFIIVSLSAYFDASGHPADSQFLVVSGLIASVDQWILWKREWDAVLRSEEIKIFHATDCNALQKEFKGWTSGRRSWFLRNLAGIIQKYCQFSISTIVDLDDYRELNKRYMLDETFPPYALAGRTCMALINQWKREHATDSPLETFFERGDHGHGKFTWRMETDGLPAPIFRDRRELVALQAADLLAWAQSVELRRLADEKRKDSVPPREVIKMLLEVPFQADGKSYHGEYSRAALEKTITEGTVPLR